MPGDSKQYLYVLQDGSKVPDPLSRYQPEGVFGPPTAMYFPGPEKRVRNPERHLEDAIIYEMHVGTFTPPRARSGQRRRRWMTSWTLA
ncbi:hypothetical protein [Thermogymnomonas acidicola]|uniref:hypothetical protein n=1 Tax=Thermogymnomonas acidicola TaxID=399579 RepID=UPI0009465C09|nr:hypothetical protein [Thermogymnomonas acidicola]